MKHIGIVDHPRITMDSIPMARWMPAFDAGGHRGVARPMLESAALLAQAGADFAICPDNSAHLAWDHVQAETPIPWLHIADAVGAEARARGQLAGIETIVPEPTDFEAVDRIIFSELVNGVFTDASRELYNAAIARLRDRGCDAVALACTEIPLLVRPSESPLPTLDSTRLLALAALHAAVT